jgi:hypothetical protein
MPDTRRLTLLPLQRNQGIVGRAIDVSVIRGGKTRPPLLCAGGSSMCRGVDEETNQIETALWANRLSQCRSPRGSTAVPVCRHLRQQTGSAASRDMRDGGHSNHCCPVAVYNPRPPGQPIPSPWASSATCPGAGALGRRPTARCCPARPLGLPDRKHDTLSLPRRSGP